VILPVVEQNHGSWGTPDRAATLTGLLRLDTLRGMGIAISPRGDMLKNRVPVYARTHRVGNQLNFI
jgi:hypothetical protein